MPDQVEHDAQEEPETGSTTVDQDPPISDTLTDLWLQAMNRGDFAALWPDL